MTTQDTGPTNPLKDLVPRLKDQARVVFDKDGDHVPLFFINLSGEVGIFPPWLTKFDKDEIAKVLIQLVREQNMREYVFISEMWMAMGDEVLAHKAKGESLETLTGRQEALMVVYCNPKFEEMSFAIISRDANGKPTLGPWEVAEMGNKLAFPFPRFQNIWAQAACN